MKWKPLLYAMMIVAIPVAGVKAQGFSLFPTYTFAGCDGNLSCHTARFYLSAPFFDSNVQERVVAVRLDVETRWLSRGAFVDCSMGCAWSTNVGEVYFDIRNDFFHAGGNCWAWAPDLSDPRSVGSPCDAGSTYRWSAYWTTRTPDYAPEYLSMQLAYDGDPDVHHHRLALVTPEPESYAMLGVGLLAIGVAVSRRRSVTI